MYDGMVHCMEAGDPKSTLADERARMRRLLSTATEVCMEVAP